MNIDILHRPTALENLLAGRIWPVKLRKQLSYGTNFVRLDSFYCVKKQLQAISEYYKVSLVHSYAVQ